MRARRLVEFDADRDQAVAGVEFREIGVDVAEGGDADGLGERLGRDAEIGRHLTLRHDAQLGPFELRRRHRIFEDRDRAHFAGDLVRRVVDDVDVGTGDDEREVALAVVLHEPESDVGLVGQHRANPELQVLLRRLALGLVDEIDDESGLARLGAGPEDLPAEDEGRTHFRHGAQPRRDRAGDALGVVEPRARRQLHREQRAAEVVGGDEAGRQKLRRPERGGEDQCADEERDPPVADGGAHQPGVAAHDRAVAVIPIAGGAQEIGGDHRRHEARDHQREHRPRSPPSGRTGGNTGRRCRP